MGDAGALAWIVVLAYAAGALLALAAFQAAGEARERRFWLAASAFLLLLGLNKQVDLQMALTEVARELARAQGWYEARRAVQGLFLLALGVGGAAAAALLAVWLRGSAASVKTAAAGLLLLVLFVVTRAAAFHHVDRWVTMDVAGLRSGWWLELAGIAVVGVAALAYRSERSAAR